MSHHNSRRLPPTYSQSQQHYPQGRLPSINRAAPPTGQTADYTSQYPPPPPGTVIFYPLPISRWCI